MKTEKDDTGRSCLRESHNHRNPIFGLLIECQPSSQSTITYEDVINHQGAFGSRSSMTKATRYVSIRIPRVP